MPSAIILDDIALLRSYTLYEKVFVKKFAKELELLYNSPFLLEIKYLSKPGFMYLKQLKISLDHKAPYS